MCSDIYFEERSILEKIYSDLIPKEVCKHSKTIHFFNLEEIIIRVINEGIFIIL